MTASPSVPLRIALFSGNYNYTRDGANQALNRLVAYLERRQIPVRVYAPTVATPAFAHAGDLVSIPSIAAPGRPEYRIGLGLTPRVIDDLRRFNPTLFHISAPDLIGNAAAGLARGWNTPVVASYHTRFESYLRYYRLGWLEPLAIRYLRGLYRSCDQLYAPSACLATFLRGQDFNDDVRIWSRGVDGHLFHPGRRDQAWRAALGIEAQEVVLAFVGRLVLEKGLDVFADTVDKLTAAGIAFKTLVVGDGPERAALQARLPKAIFTGFLQGEGLARAYASADIFFNPSVTETFGNVTLEAMASGLATVCAVATGSRSLITDDVTGLLVAPVAADRFAPAIARLVAQADVRGRLGAAARETSLRYDWDTIMAGLVADYGDALRRRHADGPVDVRAAGLRAALGLAGG